MKVIQLLIPLTLFLGLLIPYSGMSQESAENGDQAVATTPTPESAPATPQGCVPTCRSGYFCHVGMCISKCNPPCALGFTCSAEAECIAPVTAPPPPPQDSNAYTAREQARMAAQQKKIAAREQRLAEVRKIRMGIHMDWQWSFSDIYRTGFLGNVGLQKNVASTFALRSRLGGMLGYARPDFFDSDDRTAAWGANFDFSALAGPLGRFYIGPTFWLTYYWYNKENLKDKDDFYDYDYDETDEYTLVKTNGGISGGLALDMGVIVGPTSNLGISWRLKTTLLEDDINLTFEFGLAYLFAVSD